jgi:hypothetical protein
VFVENGRWGLSGGGCCLKTDIGYSDWMEALGYAQAPIVKPGDIVAIAMHSKELGVFMVKLMRVGKRIDPNCVTVVELEEMKEEN